MRWNRVVFQESASAQFQSSGPFSDINASPAQTWIPVYLKYDITRTRVNGNMLSKNLWVKVFLWVIVPSDFFLLNWPPGWNIIIGHGIHGELSFGTGFGKNIGQP